MYSGQDELSMLQFVHDLCFYLSHEPLLLKSSLSGLTIPRLLLLLSHSLVVHRLLESIADIVRIHLTIRPTHSKDRID